MTNYLVVTTEQTTNDIIVFDQDADWATAGAVKWRWSAPGGAGTVWDNLSDVRMRSTRAYGPVVLVAASGGWVGMLRRDTKKVVWHAVPGGNPHAVERIAGGVIVVASSASGELRLYADSTHTEPFRTIALEMAHGVLYDPAHSCLWAIGHQQLVRYQVSGTGASTKLTVHSRTAFKGTGHDVQPVYGDPDGLWFTDSYGVYRLGIKANEYHEVDGTNGVKAYVSQPSGIRVRAKADNAGPRAWGGPTIDFFDAGGKKAFSRTRPGAEFYKARLWIPSFH
ncbi:MAG: hypothetical protein QOE54_2969 [Streptosporangiaceae bacterium]|nr:hypothetical protein [Streptosporangiaceae bacterium]